MVAFEKFPPPRSRREPQYFHLNSRPGNARTVLSLVLEADVVQTGYYSLESTATCSVLYNHWVPKVPLTQQALGATNINPADVIQQAIDDPKKVTLPDSAGCPRRSRR